MPWQRDVLDVALEVDPKTGLLVYREVVLTVPRQSGKTWLLLCLMVHRALGFGEPQRIVYAAQNRIEARKKWEDDFVRELQQSGLRHEFTIRKQIGQEAIRWNNGSLHGITSTTEKSGHGSTLDLAVLDEAFAQEDARQEQSLKPTMVTRAEPQMWIVSTAGTPKSLFLRGKVDAGRRNVANRLTEGSCFTEFSAPEDADPADPMVWRSCMPALGQTIDEGVIRADYLSMELAEFQRAYLNQWPGDGLQWSFFDRESWEKLADPDSFAASDVIYALDVTLDHQWASLGLAGRRPDGLMHVSVDNRPGRGLAWVVPRCKQLSDMFGARFLVDRGGPAWSLVPELEDAGVQVLEMTLPNVRQACGMFLDAVTEGRLRHRGQPDLDQAVAIAQPRPVGEGGPVFGRKFGEITSLNAVAFAHWWAVSNSYNVLDSVF